MTHPTRKPYPKYRPSGIEWLGDVPAHWVVKRLKYVAAMNSEVLSESTRPNLEITYIDIGSVNKIGGIEVLQEFVFEDAPSRARRVLRKGDILVSTVRTYLKAIARVSSDEKNLICSTGFAVFRVSEMSEVLSDYLFWVCLSESFVQSVVANSVGVSYPAISPSALSGLSIFLPPPPEQAAIAAFLDERTAAIDAAITSLETLQQKLREYRTALITRAVTRGLDANVPLRPSGVEWLGDVPAHWEVKRLKYAVTLSNNKLPEPPEDGLKIALENIESFTGRLIETEKDGFEGDGTEFKVNDVLFNKLRPYLAKAIKAEHPGTCVNELLVLTPTSSVISDYLLHRLLSFDFIEIVNGSTYGSKMPRASWEFIGNQKIAFPPTEEQVAIASHLDQKTVAINTAITDARQQAETLRAYRSALVTAAVTGKIDVRG